ncbi:shikimate kinase [Paraburkholderia dipogonis]|uniref:shikimate kinase n=1 Tax=Paraburkholderia dipogonis TaxID=1211383 RepID=UPI00360802B7
MGLMGTGKTTVGQRLAKHLGISFIDSDTLLESRARRSVSGLFAIQGEAAFAACASWSIDTTDRSVCSIVADIVGRLDAVTACRQ